ncbi:MAG: antibiotic biosynthesis monooxygenase [Anaerolineales bacterium]|nr:antibiotic biosynthesis monooxygenase [Anaerolineales bacterium]
MIARLWHGAVPADKAVEYAQYLRATGIPDLESTSGNQGVYVLRNVADHIAHFVLISLWESLDSIRAFAGDEIERARYYPKDADFLLELAPTVTHYEVLNSPMHLDRGDAA